MKFRSNWLWMRCGRFPPKCRSMMAVLLSKRCKHISLSIKNGCKFPTHSKIPLRVLSRPTPTWENFCKAPRRICSLWRTLLSKVSLKIRKMSLRMIKITLMGHFRSLILSSGKEESAKAPSNPPQPNKKSKPIPSLLKTDNARSRSTRLQSSFT